MLSEQSQRQKEKSCILYTMNKIVKVIDAESRIVVAGGRGRKMGSCCSPGKMFQFCKIHTFWRCAVYTLSITNDTMLLCSHSVMSDSVTPWTIAHQDPLLWDFPGKNTGLGCHFFLQDVFPIQGLNLSLLHWQADSSPLSTREGPMILCSTFRNLFRVYISLDYC